MKRKGDETQRVTGQCPLVHTTHRNHETHPQRQRETRASLGNSNRTNHRAQRALHRGSFPELSPNGGGGVGKETIRGINAGWASRSGGWEHPEGGGRSTGSETPEQSLFQRPWSPTARGTEAPETPRGWYREQPACSYLPRETIDPAWSWELGQGAGRAGAPTTPERWQFCAGNPSWCPGRQGAGPSSPIHSLGLLRALCVNERSNGFGRIAGLGRGGAGKQR